MRTLDYVSIPYKFYLSKTGKHLNSFLSHCICLTSIHVRFDIYSIKSTSIIHPFTRRNFILFTYEKAVIKFVWFSSIWGLKSRVWNFILSSSTIYSAIYIRYFIFSYLNSWNPYPTSLTVFVFSVSLQEKPFTCGISMDYNDQITLISCYRY